MTINRFDAQSIMNDIDRPRLKGPNEGASGANRRQRARARDFRALNPEVDRLVVALEAAGELLPDQGELSAQVATCLVMYLREGMVALAEAIESGVLHPGIAANMQWITGNRKAAWDARLQAR
jgi:hypothetical protein